MKDIGKELCKLGDAIATSLGCIVIAIGVFLAIALVMRSIYYCPPEERGDGSSHSGSLGRAYMMNMMANPVNKGRPFSVYHK